MPAPPIAREKLDAFGIDAICDAIMDCKSMTSIAEALDVSIGSLVAWIGSDPERSVRSREARIRTAQIWEERAESMIINATDHFELIKARDIAHHYRWRASKIAPRDFGDKVHQEVTGKDGAPLLTSLEVIFVTQNDKSRDPIPE